MNISTSISKRINRSSAKTLRGPGRRLCGNHEVVGFELNPRVCVKKIDIWWDDASFEGKDSLDETCYSVSGLEMTNVGLDATDV